MPTTLDAALAAKGKERFVICAACHGADGKGNTAMGAPNLTDGLWLYGGDRESVYRSIFYARNGSMPAWTGRLDEATLKMLAIYVHALGGGR